MAIHGVVESCNMGSTYYAERIFDAVYEAGDIDNGTFGYLEGLADGYSHIYKFVPGYKKGEPVVMVDHPAWDADESRLVNQNRDKFTNKAGTPFRVRRVKLNDEFAVNKACFTTESLEQVKVGAFVTIDTTAGKLVAVAEKPSAGDYGVIMRKRMLGAQLVTSEHTYGKAQEMFTVRIAG